MRTNVRFGSKEDMASLEWDVRYTPESGHGSDHVKCPHCAISDQKATSLNQLVGLREQRRRNFEAKRFGGLEVEDKVEA
jgi:hypothetical protein